MSHRIRPGRLLLLLAMIIGAIFVCYLVEQTAVATRVRWNVAVRQRTWVARQLQSRKETVQRLTGTTDGVEKMMLQQAQQEIAILQVPVAPTNLSYPAAITEALLTPASTSSSGVLNGYARTYPYPSPAELHGSLLQADPDALSSPLRAALATVFLIALMPLSFIVLPVSRRRARVRWAHIARVLIYGLVFPTAHLVLSVMAFSVATLLSSDVSATVGAHAPTLAWLSFVYVLCWWAAAIRLYLRMPGAWSLVLLLMVMNVLLTIALIYLFAEEIVVDMLTAMLPIA
jgi:hypothetical protein